MDFLYSLNISDDHPAVEFLRGLENTAYYVDKNSSCYILRLARCIIQVILRWANMLNGRLQVGAPLCTVVLFSHNFLGWSCFSFQR